MTTYANSAWEWGFDNRLVKESTQGINIYRDASIEKWRYNPHRRLNRARAEMRYEKSLPNPFPVHVIIEPTNLCNAECFFCSRQEMTRPLGIMQMSLYEKIVDECASFVSVDLSNQLLYSMSLYMLGEPTLSKNLRPMITYAKRMGIPYVDVSTNGKMPFTSLLGTGLNEIIVSLDGIDSATYGKNRGGDYTQVERNLKDFIIAKANGHHDAPLIRLQIIDMPNNRPYLQDFISQWIDKVEVVYVKKLEGMVQALGPRLVEKPAKDCRKKCKQLYYTLSVNWNGDVAYCCHDPKGESIIGNVWNTSIQELWQDNVEMRKVRHEQENGIYNDFCSTCVDWGNW
jgi:radical SAM protein with 4Fe4S-binding SPASM domain